MSSSALRIIAIFLAMAALLMGYLGYRASHEPKPDINSQLPSKPTEKNYQVLVAASDIPKEHVITESDITSIEVTAIPNGIYTTAENVLGKQTRVEVGAGDYFFAEQFHDYSALVSAIPEGKRAIAIRIDEVTGAGGFIEAGDKVDVLLFLPASIEVGKVSSAQRILSGVTVLAFGDDVEDIDYQEIKQRTDSDASVVSGLSKEITSSKSKEKKTSGKKSKTAVLAVNESDTSDLMLAESTGRLRLALLGTEPQSMISQAEEAQAAQAAGRQLVTLDEYKPKTSHNQPVKRPVSKKNPSQAVVQRPTKSEITVFVGSKPSSISVEKGD